MAPESLQLDQSPAADPTTQRAADLLQQGKLVVIPTETVYGLAASARQESAVRTLAELAGVPADPRVPFTVHLGEPQQAEALVDLSAPMMRRVVQKLWPGPVTLVFSMPAEQVAERAEALGLGDAAAGRIFVDGRVRLRCPAHPAARRVLQAVDGPVVAVSAIGPDHRPALEAAEAEQQLGDAAAMVIDGGRSRHGKPSTVVRVQQAPNGLPAIQVEREGVVDERYIRKLLRYTVLFVCSGNTCRSPMAELLARKVLSEKWGLAADELETAGVRIVSAGAATHGGDVASPEAVEVMADHGMDLSRHRSRGLSAALVADADVIYGMTSRHLEHIRAMYPEAEGRLQLVDPSGQDVSDPIGGPKDTYEQTAAAIEQALRQRMDELFG